MGCVHEQYGILGVQILGAPDHRRNMYPQGGIFQPELFSRVAIFRDQRAGTVHTGDELVAFAVGVLLRGEPCTSLVRHSVTSPALDMNDTSARARARRRA